jgi:hypothetical protein
MDGKRNPQPAAPLQDSAVPAFIQDKFNEAMENLRREALADLRRHNEQKRREGERPRHSPSPYGRRQPSPTRRPRNRMRGEDAGHPRSEASRRDHRQAEEYDPRDNWRSNSHQTEEYDPRGNEIEINYHKFTCPQGLKISPSSLAAFFDNLSLRKNI